RVQPHVLPAIPGRLPGDAAPLSRVSTRVPDLQRAVDSRRDGARGRLPAADGLLHLLDLPWQAGLGESVGRQRPRVGDPVTAADRELRGDADRHAWHAPVRAEQGGWSCLTVTRTRRPPACRDACRSRATGIRTTAIHMA